MTTAGEKVAQIAAANREAIDRFHEVYYESGAQAWTTWLGTRTLKCPLDLWRYQEILFDRRPDVIVESGTAHGGSASFLARMCDLIDHGRVITIDWRDRGGPEHPRIEYLLGSSTSPEIVEAVKERVQADEAVMVILDSAHTREHVLDELHAYGPIVTPNQYLVVEDTNVNGHPVRPDHGPGPMEAVEEFLREDAGREFAVDRECEKFLMTFNPGGYLLRLPNHEA
jgi:cephalosporin hydroxylase